MNSPAAPALVPLVRLQLQEPEEEAMRLPWIIAGVLAAAGAAGCRRSSQSLQRERADRAAIEDARAGVRDLDRALDEVEARLWSNRTASRLYTELAERHRRVSALACRNAVMHSEGMSRSALQDRQGRAELARRRRAEAAKSSAARPAGD
jgi:hypothetical protein